MKFDEVRIMLKECYIIKVTAEEVELLRTWKSDIERKLPNGDKIVIEMSSN